MRFGSKAKATRQTAIISIESQLLRVRVAGAFRVSTLGPPELRAKLFEQSGVGKHFVMHRFSEGVKLRLGLVTNLLLASL